MVAWPSPVCRMLVVQLSVRWRLLSLFMLAVRFVCESQRMQDQIRLGDGAGYDRVWLVRCTWVYYVCKCVHVATFWKVWWCAWDVVSMKFLCRFTFMSLVDGRSWTSCACHEQYLQNIWGCPIIPLSMAWEWTPPRTTTVRRGTWLSTDRCGKKKCVELRS